MGYRSSRTSGHDVSMSCQELVYGRSCGSLVHNLSPQIHSGIGVGHINYYYFFAPAKSHRLKIKQLRLDMALTHDLNVLVKETAFACWVAMEIDVERGEWSLCLCTCFYLRCVTNKIGLDWIGLEWITCDSCCASANFLGQLNGLSIRTRSPNGRK